jgi:Raf kinase inhibitor-like YbhB/YbcL family protein
MTISPDTGPCDGVIEITMTGLAPNATVRLDIGQPRSDVVGASLDPAMTDGDGSFTGTRALGAGGCVAASTDAAVPPGNGTFPIYAGFQPETVAVAARATYTYTSTQAPTLTLTSDAFANNGTIPVKYSCSGEATSPPLAWSGAPAGTKAFALIVHDPDAPLAGGFTHWIVTDLPASATSLPAAILTGSTIAGGGSQLIAYRGMCPPVGAGAHHYRFTLYALDASLGLPPGKSRDEVIAAMGRHTLAMAEIVGLFSR